MTDLNSIKSLQQTLSSLRMNVECLISELKCQFESEISGCSSACIIDAFTQKLLNKIETFHPVCFKYFFIASYLYVVNFFFLNFWWIPYHAWRTFFEVNFQSKFRLIIGNKSLFFVIHTLHIVKTSSECKKQKFIF